MEGAGQAGDLSEEVDEAQSCGNNPLGEEEGYDADSESNPGEMAKQEEGMSTRKYDFCHAAQLYLPFRNLYNSSDNFVLFTFMLDNMLFIRFRGLFRLRLL